MCARFDRRGARAVVLAILVGFAGQLAYMTVAEEPYPAIMMPRFAWAGPPGSSAIDVTAPDDVVFVYADTTIRRVTEEKLFEGITDTAHRSVIIGNLLSPLPTTPGSRAPPGKYAPPTWLFPGYGLARAERFDSRWTRSLKDWLRARARTFYDGAAPVQCRVDWYNSKYGTETFARGARMVNKTFVGRFEAELGIENVP